MTETERLALTAAFLAAAVVAGLGLSYVVHVELVTLVVFTGGVLLGARRGFVIGAVGMPMYVFANSALKGFPPSPLPVLAAQSLGMSLAGIAGGLWKGWWLAGGIPRRSAWLALPILGGVLAGVNQAVLNLAYAYFLTDPGAPRMTVFLSGMAFGVMDMVSNAVIFAFAGPPVTSLMRRLARRRGWWRPAGAVAGALLALLLVDPAGAQPVPVDSGAADTLSAPSAPDSLAARKTEAVPPAASPPRRTRLPLRPLTGASGPLWTDLPVSRASVLGSRSLLESDVVRGGELARVVSPHLPASIDRWALGWGRTRFTYDGIPLRGAVHGMDIPPDLPFAWQGDWKLKRTASGTQIEIGAPRPPAGDPRSQVSLTTGSLGRRTAEFGLFRTFGPINFGVDFQDREGQGIYEVSAIDSDRLWLHLDPISGRPRWSLDLATARERRTLFSGRTFERGARRAQGSLRGPFLGGETRIGGQFRRTTVTYDDFGELRFDGGTLQADWAAPIPGLTTRIRGEYDRRRNLTADRSFQGIHLDGAWNRRWGDWSLGVDGSVGTQEPYGGTWSAAALLEVRDSVWAGNVSVSHEEDLPPMVFGIDRPAPEDGFLRHLLDYESAPEPEQRTAVRLEGSAHGSRISGTLGGWVAREQGYRIDSNPLWSATSFFAPLDRPSTEANFVGLDAEVRLEVGGGVFAVGEGRIHSRDLNEVPYLSDWVAQGSLHWRRFWFHESIDLDASIGGLAIGRRFTPEGLIYPSTGIGYLELLGRIDNGIFTVRFDNLVDAYMEADLRADDLVTPFPVAGRTVTVGLTMYLTR